MSAHPTHSPAHIRWHAGLAPRLGLIACLFAVEILILSFLVQGSQMIEVAGVAAIVREAQHWLFRFMIAYGASLVLFVALGSSAERASMLSIGAGAPLRRTWALVHAAFLVPLAYLSASLYRGSPSAAHFLLLAGTWHLCAAGAGLALMAALAPREVWIAAWRKAGRLPLYALLPSLGAVLAIHWSQELWAPAAGLNFRLVAWMLRPFCPGLHVDLATLIIGTDRFRIEVSDVCSGFEGVGLMLVFCAAWLWLFRREFYFPRALLIIPVALTVVFLLNAVRIAALVLIGDAGHARIAVVGFHSQAGWIAFNLVAFSVAIVARRSAWLNRNARAPKALEHSDNPVAPFLMPLLAILAAGMVARALAAGFDWLYPLRLIGAAAMLWAYRRRYRLVDWRCSWRAAIVGAGLFLLWICAAQFLLPAAGMPPALAAAPAGARSAWILCRIAAAAITVPLAEELAYRGYLMRRLAGARFDEVAFDAVRWPALALSSVAFGVMHGSLWPAGIAAGAAFGLIAKKTNRIGEAVAAHAVANVLLAAYILTFDQWQFW